ncbi:MAG: proton-conducting transporter membrane subunit [Lentisphaeria bacterium]
MNPILLWLLVPGPILFGLLALFCPGWRSRGTVAWLAGLTTAAAGIVLAGSWGNALTYELPAVLGPVSIILELAVMVWIVGIAWKIRSTSVAIPGLLQLGFGVATVVLARQGGGHEAAPGKLLADPLAMLLVLVISIIGSLIVIYAIGYMRNHDAHAPATAASNNRFFFVLIAFLGLMNGLVLCDDLRWLAIFWECTTLCSFFLIGHDGTPEACNNAKRALLLNTWGGVAMAGAGCWLAYRGQAETLTQVMAGGLLLPVALLSFAALVKSAQMPFQSWLLGAMVAPTPVSALLHSSTMVKAGSYLVLRLVPAFGPTQLAAVLAIAGGFTFAVTSAIAISQSNAKKVLAYSTIANLGLIVACAGLNTPLAYAAALMLLVFHAVSKSVLFLAVGAIEQGIGSRHIEDMSGILRKMPLTASFAALGMVSMMMPPFGMLAAKWMAIESAVNSPLVLMLIIIGSALTVFFWSKWIGRITTISYHPSYAIEKLRLTMLAGMAVITVGVLLSGGCCMWFYKAACRPMAEAVFSADLIQSQWTLLESASQTVLWPIFAVVLVLLFALLGPFNRLRKEQVRLPFMCGENVTDARFTFEFRSLKDLPETAQVTSYYFSPILGELAISSWANPVAALILATLFGVLA